MVFVLFLVYYRSMYGIKDREGVDSMFSCPGEDEIVEWTLKGVTLRGREISPAAKSKILRAKS